MSLLQELVQSSVARPKVYAGQSEARTYRCETVLECAANLGIDLRGDDLEERENTISGNGEVSPSRMRILSGEYEVLRAKLLKILEQHRVTPESILMYEQTEIDTIPDAQEVGSVGSRSRASYEQARLTS